MTEDARFEDGKEAPLRLRALDAGDLSVIAALCQDAVFPATEMKWDAKARRFGLLLNRFRWEDVDRSKTRGRPFERVQAVLSIEDVQKVQSQGIDRSEADMVYSILSITFAPGEDGTGRVEITLAGDGALAFDVEALEVMLRDVTRPYAAPSAKAPSHPE